MADPAFRAAQQARDRARATPEARRRKNESRKRRGVDAVVWRRKDRRNRAAKAGVPFDLHDEPALTAACRMCHRPFECATPWQGPLSPSLDRVVPALGYVPGNVQWIHRGCNHFKRDMTLVDARAALAADPGNERLQLLVAYIASH